MLCFLFASVGSTFYSSLQRKSTRLLVRTFTTLCVNPAVISPSTVPKSKFIVSLEKAECLSIRLCSSSVKACPWSCLKKQQLAVEIRKDLQKLRTSVVMPQNKIRSSYLTAMSVRLFCLKSDASLQDSMSRIHVGVVGHEKSSHHWLKLWSS